MTHDDAADVSRRRFLCMLPLASALSAFARRASAQGPFIVGWNHPWVNYGTDYGENAWGHAGISTNGWTCETFQNSQGFIDASVSPIPACSRRGSLRIRADLVGGDSRRSNGEIHVNLGSHGPILCPRADVPSYLNLDGRLVRASVVLPPGSAGVSSARNGIQLMFKTRISDEQWPSLYTRWENIDPTWEGRCVDVVARVSRAEAAYADPAFDPTRVTLAGFKVGINTSSPARITGDIHLAEYAIDSDPPSVFRFEDLELASEFRAIREFTQGALSLVRVFVVCDGRCSPEFGNGGQVTGFDRFFATDFDALLESAARSQVQVIPVLFDYTLCGMQRTVSGVQLGGRASVIRRPQSLLDALAALLDRYGRHPSIWAWEAINEPEWIIREFPDRVSGFNADLVSFAEMRSFVAQCAALVHGVGGQITLGSARRKWVPQWRGTGLDYYQFHHYDHFADEAFPFARVGELGLDAPCLIGEVPVQRTAHSPAVYIAAAEAGGYAGVLFWSCRGRDEFSGV